jgi:predicted enzyme related to lactoylglutathione lyase
MPYLHGKFVWFEHVSDDVSKAREFYAALFGWKIESLATGGAPYVLIRNGAEGIGGFRTAATKTPSHWLSYLSVADVEATVTKASDAGATVLLPATDFGSFGRGATLADPTGAMFSVWKGSRGDPADQATVAPGHWYWNECMSADADKALAFYERVFGFGHETMRAGPAPYHVLTHGGVPRGGLMPSPDPVAPSGWMPYVSVSDCDAAVAKAASLGARTLLAPIDMPDVGRFAVLRDSVGAAIGVIHGKFTA